MVVTCYVEGCNSGYESYEKIYFFKPKDDKVLSEWQKLIGKQNAKLKKHHSVCHKHFEDADIMKQKIYDGKDGPIVMYDFCRWRLTDGALPKLRTGNQDNFEFSMLLHIFPLLQENLCKIVCLFLMVKNLMYCVK